ncbi:MAG: TonB-dependent receptor [Bacteroidota bacterium]|nr:TonB-dependent receptor [Bacteroidota bacterium]
MKSLSLIINCKKWFTGSAFGCMLLLGIPVNAANTGKIEGTVTDAETYKAIPAARVELLREKDSTVLATSLTDINGKYILSNIGYGRYALRISGMSYQKQMISDVQVSLLKPNVTFGTTNLIPASTMLKEASVTAYKITGQMDDDKTIYTIKEKSAAIAQSGLDLLRQLPEITVDYRTNAVTLAGSNNILFQVNGKRVDQSYLQQINPNLIDKIEVITNPGVKYDADVDAVINIIMKKNIERGISGRISLESPTVSNNFFFNDNASIDYYVKKFRFFVSGYYGMSKWSINNEVFREDLVNGLKIDSLTQHQNGKSDNQWGGFNYGADWFLSDNDMLNFYSSVRPKMKNNDELNSLNTFLPSPTATPYSHTISSEDSKNWNNDYSLFYKHKFAKKDQELTLESYYGINNSESLANYNDSTFTQAYIYSSLNKREQGTNNSRRQFSFKADYTHPFTDKLKASGGYNLNFSRIHNTFDENVSKTSDDIHYNEDRHSIYGNIAWTVGKLNLQSGLRYEFSDLNISHNGKSNSSYSSFLPFASIQYKLGQKQTLRFNYRRSVQRPGMSQVSPFNVKQDNFNATIGNKDLTPAYINKLEFTHRIQLMGPMYVSYRPYVSFITEGIQQVNLTDNGTLVQKYLNVSRELEYGVTLSGTLAFAKWWTINPSYTYFKRETKADPDYGIEASNRTSWRLNLSSQFILPKEWVVFVQYNYNAPDINHQTKTERNFDFVTGFYKPITKKVNITAYVLNPWLSKYTFQRTSVITNNVIQTQNGWINYDRILNVRLTFNFNSGKEGKKLDRQRDSDTETESASKKGIM